MRLVRAIPRPPRTAWLTLYMQTGLTTHDTLYSRGPLLRLLPIGMVERTAGWKVSCTIDSRACSIVSLQL